MHETNYSRLKLIAQHHESTVAKYRKSNAILLEAFEKATANLAEMVILVERLSSNVVELTNSNEKLILTIKNKEIF